ncbi:MAG: thioesterase family protein [bacterium]|nr:thioesterase family protein [bacterium]
MTVSNRFTTETIIRARYAETDAQGVVHHSNYIVWFEAARSDYSRERGHSYAEFEQQGRMLMVSEIQVRYIRPTVYDQVVVVRAWIETMKSRQVVFGYEVCDAASRDTLVTGTTKHICVDRSGRVVPIPPEWRAWGDDITHDG